MPKTKTPETMSDQLRAQAGRASGARYEEAIDLVAELEERKDAAETAVEALEELDTIFDNLNTAAEAVSTLTDAQMGSPQMADLLAQAAGMVDEANGLVSKDDLQAFIEAWDEAQTALETYSDTKEQDPFPGKREELEEAWNEATAALETLADALDTAEATQASENELGSGEVRITYAEQKLLDRIDKRKAQGDEVASIAGVEECVSALDLIDKGVIVLVDGNLTRDMGGSGTVRRA
jgi:hypothetical protein